MDAYIPLWVLGSFFLVVGAVVGSFLNVLIFRLPEGLSVVTPRSRCPHCSVPIKAHDNIPIVSWLILGGRCRSCKEAISVRYPVVEAICALLFLLVFFKASSIPETDPWSFVIVAMHGMVLTALLLAVTMIDLDHFIIPDVLSMPGFLVGLGFAFVGSSATGVSWQQAALGALLGSSFLLVVAMSYKWVRGREGMGMGDVKLMTTIGAFLGAYAIPFVIFSAALQGTILALLWALFLRKSPSGEAHSPEDMPNDATSDPEGDGVEAEPMGLATLQVPFGPFLALGALEWYLFSDVLRTFFPML